MHCFLSRDGERPAELLSTARAQLAPYPSVVLRQTEVLEAHRSGNGFSVRCDDGSTVTGRKLLLATGVVDHVPSLPGIELFYGKSVHHCPYCDAWEHRQSLLAVYGRGTKSASLGLMMRQWSDDVIICTSGPPELTSEEERKLAGKGILVLSDPISALEGRQGSLERIRFEGGRSVERRALFFTTGLHQRSPLFTTLGCAEDDRGGIITDAFTEETSVPGVYAAGDASRDVFLLIVAAAEGAKAAIAINSALLAEDGWG